MIENLDLTDEFGNSVPNLEFEVETESSITVGTMLNDLCSRAGVNDVSTIGRNETVRGARFYKNSPVATYLPTLETAYRFRSTQQNGEIRFIRRDPGMTGTLSLEDLGGRDVTESKPENGPITYTIVPQFDTPRSITVNSFDPDREYETNAQIAIRSTNEGSNDYKVELPYTITAQENRELAEIISRDMWSRKWGVTFRTSDKYSSLRAGDIIGLPFNDEIKPVLIVSHIRGRNGVIEITGVFEDFNSESVTVVGQSADTDAVTIVTWATSILIILDAPLIAASDDDGGVYWAATGDAAGWSGCDIMYSTDDTTYFEVGESNAPAGIGSADTTLAAGPTVTWDRTNTLTITLFSPDAEISSATEAEVLAGANLLWVGDAEGKDGELIQFVDATLVSGTTYTLSTLLRGRYGTEHRVDQHAAYEMVVLMDSSYVGSVTFNGADWGKDYYYSCPTQTQVATDASTVVMNNTGIRSKPLAPTHVRASRDASNNLTVTWVRRARGEQIGFGDGPVPLNEATEAYEIDITGAGGVVIRTISATSETLTYSGADQFSDGITPGDPVDMSIYQISDTAGRGYPARATV
jgi:hypothetical protein